MLDSDYAHAEVPKAQPEMPVRVFLNSQLIAALRQHARPIVIEDQVLARPFVRLLRARDLRLGTVGALLAERIFMRSTGTMGLILRRTGTSGNTSCRAACNESS